MNPRVPLILGVVLLLVAAALSFSPATNPAAPAAGGTSPPQQAPPGTISVVVRPAQGPASEDLGPGSRVRLLGFFPSAAARPASTRVLLSDARLLQLPAGSAPGGVALAVTPDQAVALQQGEQAGVRLVVVLLSSQEGATLGGRESVTDRDVPPRLP